VEPFWRLHRYWGQDGYCYKPDTPVFYVHFIADLWFTDYHLPGTFFLEKYPKVYDLSKKESLVLFIESSE
jgi:hypothetical protein